LRSALNQTYPNIEIIACDNSDDDQTGQIVKQYELLPRGKKIKYVKNEQNIGPIANLHKCFDLSTGEYINYLISYLRYNPQQLSQHELAKK
jgi:glycosyltransferase involved in cell wall biosynthesis